MSQETTGKNLYQDLPPEERLTKLQALCYTTEKTTILHHYSDEELIAFSKNVANKSTALDKIEREKKEMMAIFDEQIKPLKSEIKGQLDCIIEGSQKVPAEVYLIDDQENGVMETFDAQGNFLGSRRLFPQEKQTLVVRVAPAKTGTNN